MVYFILNNNQINAHCILEGLEDFVLTIVASDTEEEKARNTFILSPSLLQKANIQVNITNFR